MQLLGAHFGTDSAELKVALTQPRDVSESIRISAHLVFEVDKGLAASFCGSWGLSGDRTRTDTVATPPLATYA